MIQDIQTVIPDYLFRISALQWRAWIGDKK